MDNFKIVKDSVPMQKIMEYYGYKPNRMKKYVCLFHDEKTPSLKIYDGNRGFYCFGCGKSGSVIDFVSAHNSLEPIEAVKWISEAFHLGLEFDAPMSEFSHLLADVRRLAMELEYICKQGREARLHNSVMAQFNTPLANVQKLRNKYKNTLSQLNKCKRRLFSGKFDDDIKNFFETTVKDKIDRQNFNWDQAIKDETERKNKSWI